MSFEWSQRSKYLAMFNSLSRKMSWWWTYNELICPLGPVYVVNYFHFENVWRAENGHIFYLKHKSETNNSYDMRISILLNVCRRSFFKVCKACKTSRKRVLQLFSLKKLCCMSWGLYFSQRLGRKRVLTYWGVNKIAFYQLGWKNVFFRET